MDPITRDSHQTTRMKTTERRTWAKWGAEIGYNVSGWQSFIRALRQYYLSHDELPSLFDDCIDVKNKPAVNFALIDEKKIPINGVDELVGTLDHRQAPAGWTCITGVAGTGKSTIMQYIAYGWGRRNTVWHNRFDFVFQAKLHLLNDPHFLSTLHGHTPTQCLVRLIHKSLLGAADAVTLENIEQCLKKHPNKVLLLLDGFDEIQSLYSLNSTVSTLINDALMRFPNGILTSRPASVEHMLSDEKLFFSRTYENIGLTEDTVRKYVQHYFERQSPAESPDALLTALSTNPELMRSAQIPAKISELCLTWTVDQRVTQINEQFDDLVAKGEGLDATIRALPDTTEEPSQTSKNMHCIVQYEQRMLLESVSDDHKRLCETMAYIDVLINAFSERTDLPAYFS